MRGAPFDPMDLGEHVVLRVVMHRACNPLRARGFYSRSMSFAAVVAVIREASISLERLARNSSSSANFCLHVRTISTMILSGDASKLDASDVDPRRRIQVGCVGCGDASNLVLDVKTHPGANLR